MKIWNRFRDSDLFVLRDLLKLLKRLHPSNFQVHCKTKAFLKEYQPYQFEKNVHTSNMFDQVQQVIVTDITYLVSVIKCFGIIWTFGYVEKVTQLIIASGLIRSKHRYTKNGVNMQVSLYVKITCCYQTIYVPRCYLLLSKKGPMLFLTSSAICQ